MNSMVYTTWLVENDGTLGEDSNHDGDGDFTTIGWDEDYLKAKVELWKTGKARTPSTTSTTRPRRMMGLALMQARLRLAAITCPMRMTSAHRTPPQASTAVPKNHHHHHHHHQQQQQQPLKTTYAQPNSPARHIPGYQR
jgi:hypothetical protein